MAQDRCLDSEVWLTRDADKNAIGDMFRSGVSSFPVIGPFVSGFVPDTMTKNVVRQCQGLTIDRRSSFALDYILLLFIVLLLISYYLV
jgi:hypothetical protein